MRETIAAILSQGPATSKEIQARTGLTQAAVSRQLRMMGDSIIRRKVGRVVYYAMTRNAFGGSDRFPLFMVDAHGNNTAVANIRPLAHGGFFVQPLTGASGVLAGERGDGFYDDLPYFLYDLAPQGYLGRHIAEEMATQSPDFPNDPRQWNVDHIGRYLISNGDDLPGNFKFGEQAHLRVRRKPRGVTSKDYPQLADEVIRGILPGSSAGGEQPKFTAFCSERMSHVIVKFSPTGDDAIARRWRDILIAEFHAAEALHHESWPAAETTLIEAGGRLFLESQRFDRSGEYGRMSMISMQAIDSEFTGIGNDWYRVAEALFQRELISWQHYLDVLSLWCFGKLINNTDMHLGNLSLGIDGNVFRILPVYDMCPMGFAPQGGQVLPYDFSPRALTGVGFIEDCINDAVMIAHDFWERVAGDDRISKDFREFLAQGNPMDRLVS